MKKTNTHRYLTALLSCHCALTALLLCGSLAVSAQQFQSTHLRAAAKKLKIDSTALTTDVLPTTKTLTVAGRTVAVRMDAHGVVEHIGVPLFTEDYRQLMPSPIYDFLEYTVLDRLFKVSDNTLTHQDLKFEKGDLNALATVLSKTDGCTIENLSEKYYRVKWTANGQAVIVVSFPIDYELLANSSRKEMEQNFIRDLKAYTESEPMNAIDYSAQMAPTDQPNIFVVRGNTYIIDEINSHRYLTIGTKQKKRTLALLYDRSAPQQSMANLLVERDMPVTGARVAIEFVLGNYKRDTISVALRDFIGFCQRQGCEPFFGYEESTHGTHKGLLIMSNKQSGYDHIIAVRATDTELFGAHPLVHAKVYLFTPSSNVRTLFGSPDDTPSSRIKLKR